MSEATPEPQVVFTDNHRPALDSGDYEIAVTQQVVSTDDHAWDKIDHTFAAPVRKFSVLGPRFALDPQEISAVFPPNGSLGEHSNVLPHIMHRRTTLPWERHADPNSDQAHHPWLCLLLFDEDEMLGGVVDRGAFVDAIDTSDAVGAGHNGDALFDALLAAGWVRAIDAGRSVFVVVHDQTARAPLPDHLGQLAELADRQLTDLAARVSVKTMPFKELVASTHDPAVDFPPFVTRRNKNNAVAEPELEIEFGDAAVESVSIVDVPGALLEIIMPTRDDLTWLTHVRASDDGHGTPDRPEVAIQVTNRVPRQGAMSTMHLVSVEARFPTNTFAFGAADTVRLVSLHTWRFACVSEKQSFKGLLMHLNHQLIFSVPATPPIQTALKAETIGADSIGLLNAFRGNGHPLPESARIHAAMHRVVDGERWYYLFDIDGTRRVMNQAGVELFAVSEQAENLADLRPVFEHEDHPLSPRARLVDEHFHWLITASADRYLLGMVGTNIYCYHLDQDLTATLRLPRAPSSGPSQDLVAIAEARFLATGSVPLRHDMRHGNSSVSWYRGPLVSGLVETPLLDLDDRGDLSQALPARSADDLVRYDADLGMFDVSYAAAWELGRSLTLQAKSTSVSLFNWKRSHAQMLRAGERHLSHLPLGAPSADFELPADVRRWFASLGELEGVPFNYLVPDPRMLPEESLRFFQIDPQWIDCMVDGAFSIGRVQPADHQADVDHSARLRTGDRVPLSGFLLRSDLVSGWPALQVDGYDELVTGADFDAHAGTDVDLTADDLELLWSGEPEELANLSGFEVGLSASTRVEAKQWRLTSGAESFVLRLGAGNVIEIDGRRERLDSSVSHYLSKHAITPEVRQAWGGPLDDDATVETTRWYLDDRANHRRYVVRRTATGGIARRERTLPIVRRARLSANVLLVIFEGVANTVDIHLAPEALHFGLSRPDPESGHPGYYKVMRDAIGVEHHDVTVGVHTDGGVIRVVGQTGLLTAMKAKTSTADGPPDLDPPPDLSSSADLALQMVEGVQKVRFVHRDGSPA